MKSTEHGDGVCVIFHLVPFETTRAIVSSSGDVTGTSWSQSYCFVAIWYHAFPSRPSFIVYLAFTRDRTTRYALLHFIGPSLSAPSFVGVSHGVGASFFGNIQNIAKHMLCKVCPYVGQNGHTKTKKTIKSKRTGATSRNQRVAVEKGAQQERTRSDALDDEGDDSQTRASEARKQRGGAQDDKRATEQRTEVECQG